MDKKNFRFHNDVEHTNTRKKIIMLILYSKKRFFNNGGGARFDGIFFFFGRNFPTGDRPNLSFIVPTLNHVTRAKKTRNFEKNSKILSGV